MQRTRRSFQHPDHFVQRLVDINVVQHVCRIYHIKCIILKGQLLSRAYASVYLAAVMRRHLLSQLHHARRKIRRIHLGALLGEIHTGFTAAASDLKDLPALEVTLSETFDDIPCFGKGAGCFQLIHLYRSGIYAVRPVIVKVFFAFLYCI